MFLLNGNIRVEKTLCLISPLLRPKHRGTANFVLLSLFPKNSSHSVFQFFLVAQSPFFSVRLCVQFQFLMLNLILFCNNQKKATILKRLVMRIWSNCPVISLWLESGWKISFCALHRHNNKFAGRRTPLNKIPINKNENKHWRSGRRPDTTEKGWLEFCDRFLSFCCCSHNNDVPSTTSTILVLLISLHNFWLNSACTRLLLLYYQTIYRVVITFFFTIRLSLYLYLKKNDFFIN